MSKSVLIQRAAGVVVAVLGLVALRGVSLVPVRSTSVGESVFRLSWSARPERIEDCRRLSDEEMAALPQHMRLRWSCEGRFARYHLAVTIDGTEVASDTVRGGGFRNDRPIHLFREYGLNAGERRLNVVLRRIDSGNAPDTTSDQTAAGAAAADRETREAQERRARRAEAIPEELVLDTLISVQRGQVILLSYSSTDRNFHIQTDSSGQGGF